VTLTHFNSELFALWYLPQTTAFWKYQIFPSPIIRKIFQSAVALKGANFRSAVSVLLLIVLYYCPVFSRNLVLYIFHSAGTVVFFFYRSASCCLALVKIFIMWFIHRKKVDIIKWRILLSEVSEQESSLNVHLQYVWSPSPNVHVSTPPPPPNVSFQ